LKNIYIDSFASKSNSELAQILSNPLSYNYEAVLAAKEILKQRKIEFSTNEFFLKPEEGKKVDKALDQPEKHLYFNEMIDNSLDPSKYLNSLNFSVILTILSIAVGASAILDLFKFMNSQIFSSWFSFLIYLTGAYLAHIWYKYDFQTPNIYIGRVINDLIYILFLYLISNCVQYIRWGDHMVKFNGLKTFEIIISLIVFCFLAELFFAGIKLILSYFKWEIA
jgi:hypothetical protein